MDRELASKIRALALASRCLTREMKTLRDRSRGIEIPGDRSAEIRRLVDLARTILDPGWSDDVDPPSGSRGKKPPDSGSIAELAPLLPSTTSPAVLAGERPSEQHVLALFGAGSVIPIHELIGFLGTVGKTGILRIETSRESFLLEFSSGDIVHGESSRTSEGERLGDLLVSQGAIERADLERVLEGGSRRRLGHALLEKELITAQHLTAALRAQIQSLFVRLFREEAQGFSFWGGPPLHAERGVRLNSTSLLLEGARYSDEVDDGLRTIGGARIGEGAP